MDILQGTWDSSELSQDFVSQFQGGLPWQQSLKISIALALFQRSTPKVMGLTLEAEAADSLPRNYLE